MLGDKIPQNAYYKKGGDKFMCIYYIQNRRIVINLLNIYISQHLWVVCSYKHREW